MNKYNNSCVYKIECNDKTVKGVYIGSTTNYTMRQYQHKSKSKSGTTTLYKCIQDNGGWVNWTMSKQEICNVDNIQQLLTREKAAITELTEPSLNIVKRPHRTTEELKEWKKQHNITNKDKYQLFNKTKKECDICHKLKSRGNFAKHRKLCETKHNITHSSQPVLT